VNNFSDFSAIIFDLDGLVLDTESTYLVAWRQAAEIMGYDFSVISAQTLSGLHYQAVVEILLATFCADFDLIKFNRLSAECWRDYVQQHGITRKPGFDELLAAIKQHNIPFCLATNSAEMNARECLGLAGLTQVFSVIISRDDVKHGKPAPDIFLIAAQRLQQPIEQCLVLEDSLVGIQAAQAAGAMSILIPSILPLSESRLNQNTTVFADLSQVAEIIREDVKFISLPS
jgi:HAD superfamily hydrolase (TIGR01509 family)